MASPCLWLVDIVICLFWILLMSLISIFGLFHVMVCIWSCPLCECWNVGMWLTVVRHVSSQSTVSQCTLYEDLFGQVGIPTILNSICLTWCIPWFRSSLDYGLMSYGKVAFKWGSCPKWLQGNPSEVCLNKW